MRETLLTTCLLFYSLIVVAQFGPQQIISDDAINPYLAIPLDIDNDGFVDILSLHHENYLIKWNRNLDGLGNFGEDIIVSNQSALYLSMHFVDLDNDGDKDLLYTENNPREIGWFENLDGNGNFADVEIIFNETSNVNFVIDTIDIDDDDDLDLIVGYSDASFYGVVWFENDGAGNFGSEQIILGNIIELYPPLFVDIDNDGLLDILTSHEENAAAKVVWYKNLGNVTFGPEQEIYQFDFFQSDWTSIWDIKYIDINSDNKKDVVFTSHNDDFGTFHHWVENIDSLGTFGEIRSLPPYRIFFDIENDGDNDIIYGDRFQNRIFWVENSDGLGSFTTERTITTEIDFLRDLSYADLNGDGILDLVSASLGDEKVAWYENTGVLGIPKNTENAIEVYPNPVNEKLFFTSIEAIISIEIFDSLGSNLGTYISTNEVNFSAFASGIYFVKITLDDGTTQVKKVLKE